MIGCCCSCWTCPLLTACATLLPSAHWHAARELHPGFSAPAGSGLCSDQCIRGARDVCFVLAGWCAVRRPCINSTGWEGLFKQAGNMFGHVLVQSICCRAALLEQGADALAEAVLHQHSTCLHLCNPCMLSSGFINSMP
eukprot:352029-Chlamydomonas_euryale.AAC.3